MKVILKSKHDLHYATGIYDNGGVTVLSGSRINQTDSFPQMAESLKDMRCDPQIVDDKGVLIKDVSFNSPSTAAQFVTGRSVNGYIAWRPDDKMSLKEYISKKQPEGGHGKY